MILQKLQFTLFFLIGFALFWYVAPIGTSIFKKRLTKINPGLVEKAPWYFTIVHYLTRFMAVMCLVYIVLVWLGVIKFQS
ncbi:hypothetical protein M0M57_13465 [Flavobacterium azooxidireducens]|uniref:Uncharacterized protein n=1 Tax=Flavobacterium azooxidireducens TaxID=1871076 RepID=A0ABY4KGU6_9FLAO|nr:hypothetical protein [Flavobacterium azooxidireducens]UPQ78625.1 hypothetical protein M0M57_13465 [Flavobacterium azooxidireducens]